MKTKLFTDSDLDGIGCGIVMSNAGEVDITYSNPRKINNDIIAFINDGTYSEYGMIFITDLSVTIETADLIENVFDKGPVWRLLDHHLTGVHLRPYLWSIIKTHDDNGELCCGTYLIHEVMRPLLKNPVEMDKFVSLVNSYDTFNWVKEDRIEAKHFNDLFGIYGRDRFISHNKTKQLRRFKTANYTVGVIFNEKYVSETGKTICENEPDLDFIILLDYGYRTAGMRTIRDDIDLSEIAKRFGGGGHKKAAGFPIEFYYNLLDSLWEKM
jgi:oligoribonuclease NrnB/cAMP/cGMP phosphodiesterase (DHH superfamily)